MKGTWLRTRVCHRNLGGVDVSEAVPDGWDDEEGDGTHGANDDGPEVRRPLAGRPAAVPEGRGPETRRARHGDPGVSREGFGGFVSSVCWADVSLLGGSAFGKRHKTLDLSVCNWESRSFGAGLPNWCRCLSIALTSRPKGAFRVGYAAKLSGPGWVVRPGAITQAFNE